MKLQSLAFRLVSALVVSVSLPAGAAELWAPTASARVESGPINEMSGLVKSPRRDNVYWVHNDSGDSARLFAITVDGKSVLPTFSRFSYFGETAEAGKQQWEGFEVLYANNVDWEDIAADANYLYVADTGNNGNARQDLGIYLLSEIDPTASTRSAVIQHLPVVYPEQKEFPAPELDFDCEGIFVSDGKLYLITKHRQATGIVLESFEQGANLYRLDTRYTDKPNVLVKIDSNNAILAATGADLSPDGNTLAVAAMDALWLFGKPVDGSDHWLSGPAHRYPFDRDAVKQLEAITWIDNQTLLLGNEQRDLFRVPLTSLPESSL